MIWLVVALVTMNSFAMTSKDTFKVIKSCTACHSDIGGNPLVFQADSEESLAAQLREDPELINKIKYRLRGRDKNNKKFDQMPLGKKPFSSKKQAAILKGLGRIKSKK